MIGIYGTGYLGQQIANYLNQEKHNCIILNRHQSVTSTVSYIVDASFPRNYRNAQILRDYLNLLENRLTQSRISESKYVYIGSYSSLSLKNSKYGLGKKAAEDLVIQYSGTVLRLGLVIDPNNPGGRYLEFLKLVRKIPIHFIIPKSWCPVYVTKLNSALDSIHTIISDREAITFGHIHAHGTKKIYLNQLLMQVSGNFPVIKVPELAMWILSFLVSIFPIGKIDNLKSIMYKEVCD